MKLLSLTCFICFSSFAFACLSASQHRIFPVGICSAGIVVVEVHLFRDAFRDTSTKIIGLEKAWEGEGYLKIYDKNFVVVSSEVIDSIPMFHESNYERILSATFDKGRVCAQHLDVVYAEPQSIWFCDYLQSCSKASLVFDTVRNHISVKLPGKKTRRLPLLTKSPQIESAIYKLYYSDHKKFNYTAGILRYRFYINSVREFRLGEQKLTIVHIGGIPHEMHKSKEYAAEFAFNDLTKSVFEEPVCHHGYGFDFFILE